MSVSESGPKLAVRNYEDLVGLVPYLIGFHPQDSLVVIVIEHGRVVVTARVDLESVVEPGCLSHLVTRLFERYPGADGWFLAYTDDDDLAWDVLAGCTGLLGVLHQAGLLQVGAAHWRADGPDGPSAPITVSAAAAEAAVLGLPARPSRQSLADSLAGPPDTEVEDLVARFAAGEIEVERIGARGRRRLLARLLRSCRPPAVGDCVRLALLAARPEGQVQVLRSLTGNNADQQVALWSAVVRHCLLAHQPAVLGLLGMAAWQTGDGALQMVCLERIDRIDPLAPIASVIEWLNTRVVPPGDWVRLRESLIAALELQLTAAGQRASRPGT